MNQVNKQNARAIVYFGGNSRLLGKLNQIYGEDCVHNFQVMKEAFDFIKVNPVRSFVFETYQENPFRGINEKDLDILLYYGSSKDSLNKRISFLPIDPSESSDGQLNHAVHFYADLYDRYLHLLPGVSANELNEESINLPEGMDFLSDLVTVLDDATDEIDKKMSMIDFSSSRNQSDRQNGKADLNEEVHVVEGKESDPFDEFSALLKGSGPETEETQSVSGKIEEDLSSQRVSGFKEQEDPHKEVISGDGPDNSESAQLVKGSGTQEDAHKEVISGDGPDNSESAQLVKGSGTQEDAHKEVISGDGPESKEATQLIKGDAGHVDKHKEIISGESSQEKESLHTIQGESNSKDNAAHTILGESDETEVKDYVSQSDSGSEENDKQVFSGTDDIGADNKHKTVIKGSSEEKDDEPGFYEVKKKSPQEKVEDTPIPADLNQRNDKGQTPIMLHALKGNVKGVRSLLDNGADPNLLCHQGKTLLHYAVEGSDDLVFIQELVDLHGLKATKRDASGKDPLFYAVIRDREELINYLIDQGSRLNTKYDGDPILHVAVKAKALRSFKSLLLAGADINAKNSKAEDVVTFCKKKKLLPFIKLITAVNRLKELKAS